MYKVNHPNEAPVIKMDLKDEPAVYLIIEEESDGKPWYHDIKFFLQSQEYPAGASKANRKTSQRLGSIVFLNIDVFYKRNYNMVLLRCVNKHTLIWS